MSMRLTTHLTCFLGSLLVFVSSSTNYVPTPPITLGSYISLSFHYPNILSTRIIPDLSAPSHICSCSFILFVGLCSTRPIIYLIVSLFYIHRLKTTFLFLLFFLHPYFFFLFFFLSWIPRLHTSYVAEHTHRLPSHPFLPDTNSHPSSPVVPPHSLGPLS